MKLGKKLNLGIRFKLGIFIFLISIIYYIYNQNMNFFYTIVSILCLALTGAMAIVILLKGNLTEGTIFKHMGIGIFFLFITNFIALISIKELSYNINSKYIINVRFIIMSLEYMLVLVTILIKKFKKEKLEYLLSYAIIYILPIALVGYIAESYKIRAIFLILLFVITILLLLNNSIIKKDEERKSLFLYSAFIATYHIIFIIGLYLNKDFTILTGAFKFIAYYFLYLIFEEFVFAKKYRGVKESLQKTQYTQENLNKILNERNKTLSELKKSIEKSEKRYSNLISSIKDGIIILNFERVTYVNKVVTELIPELGYDGVIGKTLVVILKKLYLKTLITEKFYKKIKEFDAKNCKKNTLYMITEIKRFDKEYELYFVNMNETENLIYLKDVTTVNKSHKLRIEYEEYIKEEETKNEFYSNISHELRTPINLVYSALQLNELYIRNNNLVGIEKNNNAIKQNSLRLIRTINNFIDANKITEGYLKPNLKVYNIVSVIENISMACNYYIEKIENILIFDSEEEEIYVKCDREMIERIMLNLLSNSVKYGRPNGNIFINVLSINKKVIVRLRSDNYTIPAEMQQYIFDKFTKLNKSLNRDKEGSGLGLFLVKELLTLNNATITIKSDNEVGIEFEMEFSRELYEINEYKEDYEINSIKDKVNTEFSDIYI